MMVSLSFSQSLIKAVVIVLAAFFWLSGEAAAAVEPGMEVIEPRCEYLTNPLGIDVLHPRLSWKLKTLNPLARGERQTAYQIVVTAEANRLAEHRGDLWDTGEIQSDQSVLVPYAGQPLRSGMTCYWMVRARDQRGAWSAWSKLAQWTMGLLNKEDWSAHWIGTGEAFVRQNGWPPPDNTLPDPWFRKVFKLAAPPERALLSVASIGYHEVYINGRKVGDTVLAPCTTDHRKRARYCTYDIAPFLQTGDNVLGLWLGTSWSIFPPYKADDRPQGPLVLAQADIELPGRGHVQVITDETWKTHPSPSTLLGVWDFMHYGGELVDANLEIPDWSSPRLDDSPWKLAKVFHPQVELTAQMVEPNRVLRGLRPVAIDPVGKDEYRVDMGVNFAGWVEIDLHGKPGTRITFQFSERQEEPMTHRLHSAFILGSSGKGTFRNRFNYGVGRWIRIQGVDYKPAAADIRGFLVRTDYRRTGQFHCSNELLNKIYDTTLWTFENLSLGGYLVDCPQRERMGYGGDAHATVPTGLNNYDLGALYTKWSQDWRDVQAADGNLPYTAPTYWGGGGPAWCGFCITMPWEVYRRYGDRSILDDNFPNMQHWLQFLETKAAHDMLVRWGGEWDFLGDWLWPGARGVVNGDTRETLFFNNCYWIYNLDTAARVADVLGKKEVASSYRQRAEKVRHAVHATFFNARDGSYVNGFPAYLAMALLVDLPPAKDRLAVMKRLEEEILVHRKGHIHAGITGGAFLFKTLMALDRQDLILPMVLKDDFPSWGDMLHKGATTFWESWEGDLSLLHSSYVFVGSWFTEGLAGIRLSPEEPGFKRFIIKPGVAARASVNRVQASYDSVYGVIRCAWQHEYRKFHLEITVPTNTKATVYLPTTNAKSITEGGKQLEQADGVKRLRTEGEWVLVEVEAGRYVFDMAD